MARGLRVVLADIVKLLLVQRGLLDILPALSEQTLQLEVGI